MPLGFNIPEKQMKQEGMSLTDRGERDYRITVTSGSGLVDFLKSPRGWMLSPAASHQSETNHHVQPTKAVEAMRRSSQRLPGSPAGCNWPAGCSGGWAHRRQSCSAGSDSPSANQGNWWESHATTGTCQNLPPHHGNQVEGKAVTHLHHSFQRGAFKEVKEYHSPPPGDHWSPSLKFISFEFPLNLNNF